MKSCAFTGHRDLKFGEPNIEKLDGAIYESIERGERQFLCGMAQGFDLIAAERVLKFKEKYKVELIACIPFSEQAKRYSFKEKCRYQKILSECDGVIILNGDYFNGCFLERDRYMVENSDSLICFLRRESGGTFFTYSYAKKSGKNIILI